MKRGEVWTASGGQDYAGKPRPVVILQAEQFPHTDSITICPLSTDETDAPLVRIPVAPSEGNGLRRPSRIMVDKIATIRRSKMGKRIGRLASDDVTRLSDAVIVFLGIGD
jgi:mRNA interferase MazF